MKNFNIALIEGDGVGPEITAAAIEVLNAVSKKFDVKFTYTKVEAGGVSLDKYGVPITEKNMLACKNSDSVLLAAVGGAKWDTLPGNLRPERALLEIRKELGLFANIRPAKLYPILKDACPLKAALSGTGFDLIIVRELTGGIYYGKRGRIRSDRGEESAYDTECYSELEIERIARVAFDLARGRSGNVTSIDKANVLESSRLWREVVHRTAKEYRDISVRDMLVDNAAMQLIKNPAQFDTILTSNMFGDILSDEASQITGSIGMLPSASLGKGSCGMYEPIHGSAPDIAGLDKVNPIATILSAAMMLRLSFKLEEAADEIENAVSATLEAGIRTADIATNGEKSVGCRKMAAEISSRI